MQEWFNIKTQCGLFIGVLIIFNHLFKAIKYDLSRLTSLRFFTLFFIWVGYHITPIIAIINDEYIDSFLLVKTYVGDAVLFSSFCMFIFDSAYWNRKKSKRIYWEGKKSNIKFGYIFFLSIITISIFVSHVGGIEEVFDSSYHRGSLQWDASTFQRIINVFSSQMYIVMTVIGIYYFVNNKNYRYWGFILIMASSLYGFHSFSRGSGFSFILLAVFIVIFKGFRNNRRQVLVLLFFGYFLGWVGLNGRSFYKPGLANYLTAIYEVPFLQKQGEVPESNNIMNSDSNPLDAVGAWTRKVEQKDDVYLFDLNHAVIFIYNLNPMPSSIIPPIPLGEGLSDYMGTTGSTGITTPALAELFYAFGYFGAVFIFLIGRIFCYFDDKFKDEKSLYISVCFLLMLTSVPIGLHSSSRAMTRPILYGIIIYFVFRKILKKGTGSKKRYIIYQNPS